MLPPTFSHLLQGLHLIHLPATPCCSKGSALKFALILILKLNLSSCKETALLSLAVIPFVKLALFYRKKTPGEPRRHPLCEARPLLEQEDAPVSLAVIPFVKLVLFYNNKTTWSASLSSPS